MRVQVLNRWVPLKDFKGIYRSVYVDWVWGLRSKYSKYSVSGYLGFGL